MNSSWKKHVARRPTKNFRMATKIRQKKERETLESAVVISTTANQNWMLMHRR